MTLVGLGEQPVSSNINEDPKETDKPIAKDLLLKKTQNKTLPLVHH